MRKYLVGSVQLLALAGLLQLAMVSGVALSQTAPVAAPVAVTVYEPSVMDRVLEVSNTVLWTVLAIATPIIATLIVNMLVKIAAGIGFSMDEAQRRRLQELVVNGLNALASRKDIRPAKGAVIEAGSTAAEFVTDYVKEHGPKTVAALAKDPDSASFKEAIIARANKALNDPAEPTPAVITPDHGMQVVVVEKKV